MNTSNTKRELVRERVVNAGALLVLILIGLLALIGPSGLLAWSDQANQLEEHQKRIAQLEEERAVLENRVDLLNPDNVNQDFADELVRRDLGVVHEDDVVVNLDEQD